MATQQFKKGQTLYGVFVLGEPDQAVKVFSGEPGRDTRVQKVEYFAPSDLGYGASRVVVREQIADIENHLLFKKEGDAKEMELKIQKEMRLSLYDDVQKLKYEMSKIKKFLVV